MTRRVTAALAFALLATPAAAHVGDRNPEQAQRGMFGQRPIALVAQQAAAPEVKATPSAKCGPGSKPEPSIQGRLPKEEVDSGRAAEGYWCNIRRVGQSGNTGGFKVLRYIDENGHECAYYDTTLLFPTNTLNLSMDLTGVAVLDMTDPSKPVRTDSLLTPAMQSPHESVNISVQRGLLAAVAGNPAFAPGIVDVYDISKDCRKPVLKASAPVGFLGHESGMAQDGRTFYSTSIGSGQTTAVDLTNPSVPLPLWQGQYDSHGMTLSDDGNRGYLAAGSGLIILDLSEVQARKPDPQVREISRLVWPNMTIPQVAHPVTIKGKPYLVEVDEYSGDQPGSAGSHGPVVGAARIIDISDETKPRVVSEIRLQVHQPESRAEIAGDYGAQNPTQGYAAHYCNVPQRVEPGIFACSMILSGLRVFDIRDPEKPKEIAYHYSPPSNVSETGGPVIDERANWAMSQPAFAPERGEIWYSDGTSGFYALKVDEKIWPFKNLRTASGCVDNRGLAGVSAASAGKGVRFRFERRAELPVRVDVFRVSQARKVIKERRVARFDSRTGPFTWRASGMGPGYYFARFTMFKDGKAYDTRRIVLQRSAGGKFTRRADHFRRDSCGILGKFKLERPVFGGSRNAALTAAYRLGVPAQVAITVSRGNKVVKRFSPVNQPANRTVRIRLPARGLARGEYTVRMTVARGDDQVSAKLVARRL